jgi:ribose/xylose/arabinose/galactoside ABC-type transport system permease subunit
VVTAAVAVSRRRELVLSYAEQWGIWVALLALIAVSALASPFFLTPNNLANILNQASVAGIAALGVTFVMVTGGVDLSVGSVISLSAAVSATVLAGRDENVLPAIVLALVAGLVVGLINGVLVAKRNINSFVLTLGMLIAVSGATLLYTGGTAQGAISTGFAGFFNSRWLGIAPVAWIFLATFVVAMTIERLTIFGRRLFIVGANTRAADLSGMRVDRVLIGAYALSGLFAGLAGLVLLGRVGVSSAYAGQGYEFDALAAAVLGGTTFEGGRGGVAGTFAGVLILIISFNLVSILGLDFNAQMIVKGGIIVGAAGIYRTLQRQD